MNVSKGFLSTNIHKNALRRAGFLFPSQKFLIFPPVHHRYTTATFISHLYNYIYFEKHSDLAFSVFKRFGD